jgi:hypothetical protein
MAIGSAGCLRPIASDVVELLQHWSRVDGRRGPSSGMVAKPWIREPACQASGPLRVPLGCVGRDQHPRARERRVRRPAPVDRFQAVGLRRFEGVDALGADFQPFGKLDARHTKRIPCYPVNYRAGTGATCKQQEKNRLPVKGEIYREPSSSIWTS